MRYFTWENLIYFIEQMTEKNSSEIAERLEVSKSVISRLKGGQTKKPSFGPDWIYKCIFDPADKNSLVYGETEIYLLSALKESINNASLEGILEDVEKKDYKTYIMTMLERTRNTKPDEAKFDIEEIEPPPIKGDEVISVNVEKSLTEQMRGIFENAVFCCDIKQLIRSNPVCSVPGNFFEDIKNFMAIIDKDISRYSRYKTEPISHEIKMFVEELNRYSKYLRTNTRANINFVENKFMYPQHNNELIKVTPYQAIETFVPSYSKAYERTPEECAKDAAMVSVEKTPEECAEDAEMVFVEKTPEECTEDAEMVFVEKTPEECAEDAEMVFVEEIPEKCVKDAAMVSVEEMPEECAKDVARGYVKEIVKKNIVKTRENFTEETLDFRKRINVLYSEICNGDTILE